MATLGRALIRRQHRVTAFQIPASSNAVKAQGLEFWPLGDGQTDVGQIAEAVEKLGTLTGLKALRFSIQCGASLARAVCDYAPDALQQAGVDLLIVDQNEPAGGSVAEFLRLPFVNVVSLPLNREPKVPPPFVPWTYSGSVKDTFLNGLAYKVFDKLVAPVNNVLNEYRLRWALTPIRYPDDTFSRLAQISQLTEDFDFPRESKPSCLHYLGPFVDRGRPSIPFPYERLNGKPLLYASFGTLQNRTENGFETIASACADLDAQLVLSLGGGSTTNALNLPPDAIMLPYVPQLEILARATVCVSHGGLNTVMEALSYGVPIVAIPVTNDQPAVAARLQASGAGEAIPYSRLTADRLRTAVQRLLKVPDYRFKAEHFKDSIQRAGGVERACDLVEGHLPASSKTGQNGVSGKTE